MPMSSMRLSGCEYMDDVVRTVFCAEATAAVSIKVAAIDNKTRFI
jgi:hypothetical protein